MGFRIADAAAEYFRNFVVLVTEDVVQFEDTFVTLRKFCDGRIETHAIDQALQSQIGGAELAFRPVGLLAFFSVFERDVFHLSFAKAHQGDVHGHTMEPG